MQTDNEKSGSVKFYQKRQLLDTQEINIITIDIGVQAVKPLSDHCTQVNVSFSLNDVIYLSINSNSIKYVIL